ncbi:hypothetical protein [Mycetocola saprophilus]|uniref:hypothetical protein n=1 Tax=Mycetocola saprophilus TaxID=76636 RepID=UPI003BF0700D
MDLPIEKRELVLMVDYGFDWPLSDVTWWPEDKPDWNTLITPKLREDLLNWGRFFQQYGDSETGLFGSEERRRWFQQEGFRLDAELRKQIGHLYTVRLDLWF